MKTRLLTILALLPVAIALAGCQATGATAQSVVATTAAEFTSCVRLTLHCVQADGSAKVCASTDDARIGTASDPEDLQAMQSGETVVLDEGDNLDVTVPIVQTDGKWTTVCGVTVTPGDRTRDAAIAEAKAIAEAVKASLGSCCPGCGTDCCSK